MLRKDYILESEGNGYDLVIPGYDNPQIKKIYEESKTFVGDSTGKEKLSRLLRFVNKAIDYDKNWNDIGKRVPLQRALHKRKGVCKEIAATLDMLLRMHGIESEYKRGRREGVRHAWLKVIIDDQEFLADPTNNLLGSYESVSRIKGFVEGDNIIRDSL